MISHLISQIIFKCKKRVDGKQGGYKRKVKDAKFLIYRRNFIPPRPFEPKAFRGYLDTRRGIIYPDPFTPSE